MFAEILRDARAENGMTVSELSERAGTSRAAIADYESGRKQPRFDTAARLLDVLGQALTSVPRSIVPYMSAWLPDEVVEAVRSTLTTRDEAIAHAIRSLPEILESDAELEGLGLKWGEVKTVAHGTTIAGEPLPVDRLWAMRRDVLATLRAAANGRPQPLKVVGEYLVEGDRNLPSPERELDFLVRATHAGADPARVRHLASASLAAAGFRYLWVPYKSIGEYARGVVATRRHADATIMLTALAAHIFGMEADS